MGTPEFKIEINAQMLVEHDVETDCFYASSPDFNIVRDGRTAEEAIAMLTDAFEVMANHRWENGTLESYLQSLGFRMYRVWNMDDAEHLTCYAPNMSEPVHEDAGLAVHDDDPISIFRQVVTGGRMEMSTIGGEKPL